MEVRLGRLELALDKTTEMPDTPNGWRDAIHGWGLAKSPQEVGWVICLDAKKRLYTIVEVARGTSRRLPIHLPTLLSAVLTSGTDRFVFVHSHPGGSAEPSQLDVETTEIIANAAATCGLFFDDHMIVTSDPREFFSFYRAGLYVPAEYRETEAARYGAA